MNTINWEKVLPALDRMFQARAVALREPGVGITVVPAIDKSLWKVLQPFQPVGYHKARGVQIVFPCFGPVNASKVVQACWEAARKYPARTRDRWLLERTALQLVYASGGDPRKLGFVR
jgi:hypothetical protein